MSPSLYFQLVVLLVVLYSRAEASTLSVCTLFSETRQHISCAVCSGRLNVHKEMSDNTKRLLKTRLRL